ncbi:MAG: hypothetical protein ACK5CY_07250 [Bacteroidia bacterium]|jgi:hypothetical protein
MTPFQEFVKQHKAPGFILLKNARTRFVSSIGYQVSTFEDAQWNEQIQPLIDQIPKAQLLPSKEARELASWRFSDEEIQDGQFTFDTFPASLLSETTDLDLFGASYTIFWIAEPDTDWIINAVLLRFEALPQESIITKEYIRDIWNQTIERIFFYPHRDIETELFLKFDEVIDEIVSRINALPNAPLPESWNVLNDEDFFEEE